MQGINSFTVTCMAIALVIVIAIRLATPRSYPREPPMAPMSIPIFGHMIGFIRNSFAYYEQLRDKFPLPIFTVCMPGRRIYIVTSPELISKVDKKHKAFTFNPIIKEFSGAALGTSSYADAIMGENLLSDNGHEGLVDAIVVGMRESLKPGPLLDEMNQTMAEEVTVIMDRIKPEAGHPVRAIGLAAFTEHLVTMATTKSVYGRHNPFQDEEVRRAFFAFEKGMMRLLVAPIPEYTGAKYIRDREIVANALTKYYASGHHEYGSGLAKARWNYSVRHGVAVEDIGHFEIGGSIAILLNTLPSVYWLLLNVYTYPGLLDGIRKEIDAAVSRDDKENVATVDITVIKNECPLLMSTLKETLRTRAMGTAVRVVAEDTELEGYVLRKGAMIQMPLGVAHSDREHWGLDHAKFDPMRFLKTSTSGRDEAGAYRAFGGGKHLCPGRWFATNEILGSVALFVSRFEMKPARGGEWVIPTTKNSNTVAQIQTFDYDIEANISNREGFEMYDWKVIITSSNRVTALLAGDRVGT